MPRVVSADITKKWLINFVVGSDDANVYMCKNTFQVVDEFRLKRNNLLITAVSEAGLCQNQIW